MTSSIYNRISTDVAQLDFKHVRLTNEGHFEKVIHSSLNDLLTLEANKDQTGRSFIQDVVHSLCDEGAVALVPTETDYSPMLKYGSYSIESIRVAQIVEWLPNDIRVNIYNDETGLHQEVIVPKSAAAIIENPFYAIMNEPNSILKRLTNKLDMLDIYDEKNVTGKLDILIQLPYTVRTTKKKEQAEERRHSIEEQMSSSKYGVAYIDAAEQITQLNRPADNQLVAQVADLTKQLYNQLGLTEGVFNGTAKEEEILNYYSRTIEPFANAIVDEIKRKFLTKTARSQGQSVKYFRDIFKLVPVKDLAEIGDKFTRNAILSSNEIRAVMGFVPRKEKDADALRNKNLNVKDQIPETVMKKKITDAGNQNGNKNTEGSTG